MPLNVQLVNAQVKDPDSGQMTPAGLIGSDAISTINTAKNQAVSAIEQKGEETKESIPDDYTALTDEVDELKTQINREVNYEELEFTAYQGAIGGAYQGGGFAILEAVDSTTRIRSYETTANNGAKNIEVKTGDDITITCDSGYQFAYQIYDKTELKGIVVFEWNTTPTKIENETDVWLVIALSKIDDSTITPEEITHLHLNYSLNELKLKTNENEEISTKNETDIENLNAKLNEGLSLESIIETAYQGSISNASQGYGIWTIYTDTAANRIRSFDDNPRNILIPANKKVCIRCDGGYKFAYQVYKTDSPERALDVWEFHTDKVTIEKNINVYLVVSFGKIDNSAVSPSDIAHLQVYYPNDIKNAIFDLDENADTEIEIPFTFAISEKVYKKNKYYTNLKPQNYYNTSANGITVFVSENGDDTNNGLTVNTPKKTIESCLSVSNVSTIVFLPGTYIAGTHFTAGLTVSTAINFVGVGAVVIDNGTTDPIKFTNNVYCENITFKGGNNTVISQQSDATKRAVFYHCKFTESYRLNGLAIIGGLAYVVECEAYKNAYDGFNYHANSTVIANAIEVDCTAYNNGQYNLDGADGQSSNATTSHDACPIVRLNGEYYACHGGIVADKDCNSANYGCAAGISTVTDSANYPDRMSNYWSSGAHLYLYDCISYGSKYDTAKIRSGQITSDTVYPSNYSA